MYPAALRRVLAVASGAMALRAVASRGVILAERSRPLCRRSSGRGSIVWRERRSRASLATVPAVTVRTGAGTWPNVCAAASAATVAVQLTAHVLVADALISDE